MLPSRISISLLYVPFFGVIQLVELNDQSQANPSCIRIIGNIVGDSIINGWTKQEFTRAEDKDGPFWLKYISSDGEHQFGLLLPENKWFLTPMNSSNNKYLKSPAFNWNNPSANLSDLSNPLRIGDYGWKRWVSGGKWALVANPINVQSCQPPKSAQTSSIESSSTTATPSSTASISKETIPECIRIETDLRFFENNNDTEYSIESVLKV